MPTSREMSPGGWVCDVCDNAHPDEWRVRDLVGDGRAWPKCAGLPSRSVNGRAHPGGIFMAKVRRVRGDMGHGDDVQ